MNSLIIHNQLANTGINQLKGEKPAYISASVPQSLKEEFIKYVRKNNINTSKLVRTLIVNYLADVKTSFVLREEKKQNDK